MTGTKGSRETPPEQAGEAADPSSQPNCPDLPAPEDYVYLAVRCLGAKVMDKHTR